MKDSDEVPPSDVPFEGAARVLRVADFERSVAYYTDVLGFSLAWRDGRFGCVCRGENSLMHSEGSQGCAATTRETGTSPAPRWTGAGRLALEAWFLGRGDVSYALLVRQESGEWGRGMVWGWGC